MIKHSLSFVPKMVSKYAFKTGLGLSILFLVISVNAKAQHWQKPFYGIESYTDPDENSSDIVLLFAGWKVEMAWAKTWGTALYHERLYAMGVRKLYVVQGPDKVAFESLEIETQKLAQAIYQEVTQRSLNRKNIHLRIIAHSSGAYVAHNFLTHLIAQSTSKLLCYLSYYCLDGGIGTTVYGTTLTQAIVDKLDDLVAVYAYDPTRNIKSANAGVMYNLAQQFAPKARLRAIETRISGCSNRWCLHESLVNRRPYTTTQFNLASDYGKINPQHPVCWEYLILGE